MAEVNSLSEIEKVQDVIRKKHKLLKLEKDNIDEITNEHFKPVLEPLHQISKHMLSTKSMRSPQLTDVTSLSLSPFKPSKKKPKSNIKKKMQLNPSVVLNETNDLISEDLDSMSDDDHIINQSSSSSDNSVISQSIEDDNETISNLTSDFHFDNPIINEYFKLINTTDWDRSYGVRKLKSGYSIGNGRIFVRENNLIIKDCEYPITLGLLELLLKKQPDETKIYSPDVENYKEIVLTTNAHRKLYESRSAIRNLNSTKYIRWIKLFGDSSRLGRGLLPKYMRTSKQNVKFDYVHWDDVNELVERLQLLVASRSACNQSHDNEILSIIEELREAQVIH
ncbi:uncharacterized protein LOC122853859 [Aphidius gifuensis]|uniref:uncharacterized protein LOC122853859 n=1 Tax=Aphidius gifuensis TaxID=684658 RepID=UPI001CDB6CA3|nr:uncharacterized protein LOC122853859 [Aphidius gifuensis]